MGKTIIFVSHDLKSVSKYCDKVILLNKGIFIEEGNPKKVIDTYKKILVNQFDKEIKNEKEKEKNVESKVLWKSKMNLNSNKLEYGNKDAEIIDFGILDENNIFTNTVNKNESFKIKMKVRFNKKIQEPIFAFTIKDIKGNEITGTNTMIEEVYFKNPERNDVVEVEFEQIMNLQGGEYLLSLGCTGFKDGDFTVYHRLYDVCSISVVSSKDSVGFYDMNSKVIVEI